MGILYRRYLGPQGKSLLCTWIPAVAIRLIGSTSTWETLRFSADVGDSWGFLASPEEGCQSAPGLRPNEPNTCSRIAYPNRISRRHVCNQLVEGPFRSAWRLMVVLKPDINVGTHSCGYSLTDLVGLPWPPIP